MPKPYSVDIPKKTRTKRSLPRPKRPSHSSVLPQIVGSLALGLPATLASAALLSEQELRYWPAAISPALSFPFALCSGLVGLAALGVAGRKIATLFRAPENK